MADKKKNKCKVVELPDSFWSAYKSVLDKNSLYEDCLTYNPKGKYGGEDSDQANGHFTQRCGNSCSRTTYLLSSEKDIFNNLSVSILTTLTSDTVGIVDLAAGAGGGTIGLLCSIERMRKDRQLPCLPLTIHIFAADFSEASLLLYGQMLSELKIDLKNIAIEIVYHPFVWDAEDVTQAAKLCDYVKSFAEIKEYVIFVSALSGIKKSGLDPMVRSFQHILESFANSCCTALWIEPGDSSVAFLKKVRKLIFECCTWLCSFFGKQNILKDEYEWNHLFQDKVLPGKVSCVKYDRKNLL